MRSYTGRLALAGLYWKKVIKFHSVFQCYPHVHLPGYRERVDASLFHIRFVFFCLKLWLVVHRCSLVVHRCSLVVHRCSLVVHRCSLVVRRCSLIVHRCSLVVHRCSLIVHRCSLFLGMILLLPAVAISLKKRNRYIYKSSYQISNREIRLKVSWCGGTR